MIKNNPAKNSNYYERDLLGQISPYFETKEIVAIIGSRQVGKTTLLKMIYDNISFRKKSIFLTFENRSDLEIFDSDIENFKKIYVLPYEIIFIDEFQYAKDAGQKLKYLFDTTGKKFFISGSSSLEIKEAGKYLVGRVFVFYLAPFSFSEYLRAKDKEFFTVSKNGFMDFSLLLSNKKIPMRDPVKSISLKAKLKEIFEEYLVFGGYPRVITAKNEEEKKVVLSSIIDTYLLREIRSLFHLATENELLLLSKFLSLQIGNLINYDELTNSTGMKYKEIKKHLHILEETFILQLIYPYFKNKRTELVKNPKVYFIDNGFRNKVIDNFSPLLGRVDSGALAENFVFNSLKNKNFNSSNILYWRTKSQAEVDFIIENEGILLPIEVKYAPIGKKVIGKSLYSFINKYSPVNAVITTTDEFGIRKVGKTTVNFIPIYYI